ncbi:hypothetical protein COOONC_26439, partial [Cooperia oncophora]
LASPDWPNFFFVQAFLCYRALESIVSRFAASGEGNACVVVGRGESGRTTVVKNAIDEFELSAKLLIVSVAQLGSEKNTLQMLTNDKDVKSCVLIIEDADELATRQRQSLLYLLLDTTRKDSDYQWLVFLMVQNQVWIFRYLRIEPDIVESEITSENQHKSASIHPCRRRLERSQCSELKGNHSYQSSHLSI